MNEAFKELAEFCHTSDALTLPLLREKLEAGHEDLVRGNLSDDIKDDTTLLHYACYNRRVTLDIVRYLVSLYPEAVKVRTDYGWLPLHRACNNVACPDNVVEYLVDLHPGALGVPWPQAGLPLHCLLTRPTRERFPRHKVDGEELRYQLNLDLVRMLVEAHPEALINQDNSGNSTPLLYACEREDLSMEMVQLLIDPEFSVLRLAGGYSRVLPIVTLMKQSHMEDGWSVPFDIIRFFVESAPDIITPPTMNTICRSRNVTLETVKLIIESRPDVSFLDQADNNGMLPLHNLCLNRDKKDPNSSLLPIIKYVVDAYPESVRAWNDLGYLPLSYAVNSTLEITQFLVERYPESVAMVTQRGRTAFHHACISGGIDTVKYLFQKNSEAIESVDHPALHLPFEGDRDVDAKVQFILANNINSVKAKDPFTGNLPLHAACSAFSWDISLIKKLFVLYAEAVATRNRKGRFCLTEYLARDRYIHHLEEHQRGKESLEVVIFLASQFPISLMVADKEGMLPIHYASKYYHIGIVMYLAKSFPDGVKVESTKFGLPLHCAAGQDRCGLQIVRHLLSTYPESIGVRNERVGLPLECTTNKELFGYLLLLRYPGTEFPLHCMLQDEAVLNPASVVRVFLQHFRGDVAKIDNFGRYPLHVAVSSNRASLSVVKELLKFHPAAALHQDKQGRIHLHLLFHPLASYGLVQELIFSEILSIRIDSAKVLDRNKCLPLHFACRYGAATTVLGALIESYSEAVSVGDRNGCIPLHVACRRGMLSIYAIKLLVSYDTSMVQAADKDLELPLHKACRGGHLEIIHYLLDQFAPASGMRNSSGYLPIHILCRKSGKADVSVMDAPDFTETIFRLLRAHPEAVT